MSKIVKLEDVCSKGSSNIAQKDLAGIDGKYKVFGASGYIQNVNFYHQENDYIAIVKDGSGVGRVMLLPKKSSIIGTLQYIIPNPDIDVRFLYYNLIELNLSKYASGAAIPHIYFRDYRNEQIHIPSLERQREIAAVLDKANKLIEKRKKQLCELDALAESVFYDLFGDPVTNPKGWKKKKLGELGTWQSGGTPSRKNMSFFNGNIPWVTSGELNDIYIDSSFEKITANAVKESNAKIIPKGSLLLGMYDTAALKSSINNVELSCNQAIAYSTLNNAICDTLFVYYIIQLNKELYKKEQRGVRQKNLNLSMIKDIEIISPSLEHQKQFATIIEKIEEQKRKVKEAIKESEDLFHRLMQDMLTPKYQKK